jgi:hypothetical protein
MREIESGRKSEDRKWKRRQIEIEIEIEMEDDV